MRWRPLLWLMLSLLCFTGAFYFWNLGNEWAARKRQTSAPNVSTNNPQSEKKPSQGSLAPIVSEASSFALLSASGTSNRPGSSSLPGWLQYRLTNTKKSLGQLVHSPRAILLENALIDSAQPTKLAIPDWLLAKGEPGAYIIQAKGALDDSFRARLSDVGAIIVSYIPNNAYLIRANAGAVDQLRKDA